MITPSQLLGAVLLQKPNSTNSAQMIDAQTYAFALNSTARFVPPYNSTVLSQAPLNPSVFIDPDGLYSDDGGVSSEPSTPVDMGWITENSAGLSATATISQANPAQNYLFNLRTTSYLKIDFNYLTTASNSNATGLRVQVTDTKSQKVVADNYGTAAQKESYNKITSSEGLKTNAGQYSLKVSYAPEADNTKSISYNFTITSNSPEVNSDTSSAPEKTKDDSSLNDIKNYIYPSAAFVSASYLSNAPRDANSDESSGQSSLV